jgi:hypothetical protein
MADQFAGLLYFEDEVECVALEGVLHGVGDPGFERSRAHRIEREVAENVRFLFGRGAERDRGLERQWFEIEAIRR